MRNRIKDFAYYSGKKYDGMMGRCYRPADPCYKTYGGRGIRVCSAWIKDLNSFRAWILAELEKQGLSVEYFINNSRKLQLDRIDSNGHYDPRNCRLTSSQTNIRNRRVGVLNKEIIVSSEGEEINVVE